MSENPYTPIRKLTRYILSIAAYHMINNKHHCIATSSERARMLKKDETRNDLNICNLQKTTF